jgi:hypothetical protein
LARPKGGNLTATIPCQNFTSANTKTKPNHSKVKAKDNSTQIQKKKQATAVEHHLLRPNKHKPSHPFKAVNQISGPLIK